MARGSELTVAAIAVVVRRLVPRCPHGPERSSSATPTDPHVDDDDSCPTRTLETSRRSRYGPGTDPTTPAPAPATSDATARDAVRMALGVVLAFAGIGHLTFARTAFLAQVPSWVPLDADLVVVLSGVVEIVLGGALALLPRHRVLLGWVTAAFFVAIFPGNISQLVDHEAAFGLDSDVARAVRLLFQPVLVVVALWSTGAWTAWRSHRR